MWEPKEEPTMKDDCRLVAPHSLHPHISCDFSTADFSCENSFPDASTSDHSQETSDVILSLHCREDTYSSENPFNLSFIFLESTKGEIFSSHLPLCLIHQIMRMPTNILNFFILVFVIYSLPHSIMMLIQPLLIYPRH